MDIQVKKEFELIKEQLGIIVIRCNLASTSNYSVTTNSDASYSFFEDIVDGIPLEISKTVLLKNQADLKENGLYIVTEKLNPIGFKLQRYPNYKTAQQINSTVVVPKEGAQSGQAYTASVTEPFTIDQSNITISISSFNINPILSRVSTLETNVTIITNILPLKADLISGKVPLSQLPEGTFIYESYPNLASFPLVGDPYVIYIAEDTNDKYRWDGVTYQPDVVVTKEELGLGNVDNTSDINKPVSTATQTALDLKQDLIAPAGTTQFYAGDKTFKTITNAMVGLGNVLNIDTTTTANITDFLNKRFVTDANLTLLNNTSGINTGDETKLSIETKLGVASTSNSGYLSTTDWNTFNNKQNFIIAGTTSQYWRGDKTWQTLDKVAVGLANVDNTSDINKPISTATQNALDTLTQQMKLLFAVAYYG